MSSPLADDDQAAMIMPTDADPSMDTVRAWVVRALDSVPVAQRLRAVIVVEELVSNARRHGRLPCVLRLSLDHTRRNLLVFVEDSAPDDGGVWSARAGLSFVDGLASDWAVASRLRGKTVWAEIALGVRIPHLSVPPQPPPAGPRWP